MHGAGQVGNEGVNPPGAVRMAVIAFLSFNLSMGCMFGPFGVLVTPIEQRLGVSREVSTLAVPIVTFVISLLAPLVGSLASRVSLRLLMMAGCAMMAAGFYNAVIVMFSTELVPYATGLGIDPTRGALLLTAYLVGSLVGTPLVGWAADRLGGARMIGLLCVSLACWQGLLLTHPSYGFLALLAGLAGLQGSAMVSCVALSLSQRFGQVGFARLFGISNLAGLPFAVLSVPVASAIFVRTGSYSAVFLTAAVALAIGAVLALSIRSSGAASRR